MSSDTKTVYVNDKPIKIFIWAEVQHCVNAFDSELYSKVRKGEAEIVDEKGGRIGWGGYAGDGQHIYVKLNEKENRSSGNKIPQWIEDVIKLFRSDPVGHPPQSIWRYTYKDQTVYFIPSQGGDTTSSLYDVDGNQICSPNGGFVNLGDGRCPDFFTERKDEFLIWKDRRSK